MGRFVVLLLVLGAGVVLGRMLDSVSNRAEAGGGQAGGEAPCAAENGDVNADGAVDISDVVTVLGNLFLGAPAELVPPCSTCRGCHDSGVPDRHHLLYGQPIPPDSVVPYPDSDGDGGLDSNYVCLSCHDQNFTVVRGRPVWGSSGSQSGYLLPNPGSRRIGLPVETKE